MQATFRTLICVSLTSAPVLANENVSWTLESSEPTATSEGELSIPGRELGEGQISPELIQGIEAFGTGGHPFTTAQVSVENGITPADSPPFNATGKLFMTFDGSNFVCTASVIGKSLLLTAAHCVHNFGGGDAGFADALTFEPARHQSERPFGSWAAVEIWIPRSYYEGTDVCSPQAPGVVCENDLALVVIEEKATGALGDLVSRYSISDKENFGYIDFGSRPSGQITQLGYPSKDFDGLAMIRTDSLGYHEDPNNVLLGSNQTGGSSGGPWLMNFGTKTSFSGPTPSDDQSNTVVAVTSWGYTQGTVKVQGASRFSKNTTYTLKSNIQSLLDDVCSKTPSAC